MEYLQTIFENTSFPLFSAFLLGLMTAISPCPMATNITAIGFISKDLDKSRKVVINGLIYTLGRALGYFGLATVLYFSADQFQIAGFFQVHGEKIVGPFLVVIGLLMLDFIPIKFPGLNAISEKFEKRNKQTFLSILILGVVFALAFCPYKRGIVFWNVGTTDHLKFGWIGIAYCFCNWHKYPSNNFCMDYRKRSFGNWQGVQ